MACDPELAAALRRALSSVGGVSERRMFGGLCFLVNGNMLCGVETDRYMLRVGKDRYAEALARPGARPMDFTGRPLAGFVWVDAKGLSGRALAAWVRLALAYVGRLPKKPVKTGGRPAAKGRAVRRRPPVSR